MPARVIGLRTCTMDAKGSRHLVHFAKPGERSLNPICGSRNDKKLNYKPGGGMHVNCSKCKAKLAKMREEADNADNRAAAVAAVADTLKGRNSRKALPVGRQGAVPTSKAGAKAKPAVKALPTPLPVQRAANGHTGRPVPGATFQAPVYPDLPEIEQPDTTVPTTEEVPQMTVAATPLTAFPNRPAAPSAVAQTPAPAPEPVASAPAAAPAPQPQPEPAPQPVEDDVIVVHAETYEVVLIHPVTRMEMDPVTVQARSEEEAEELALDYFEISIVKKTTRIRAARRR